MKRISLTTRRRPAQKSERAFDERLDYLAASSFRFFAEAATDAEHKAAHAAILHGQTTDLRADVLHAPKQSVRNGRVHQPATPAQELLILAETATPAAPARTAKAVPG